MKYPKFMLSISNKTGIPIDKIGRFFLGIIAFVFGYTFPEAINSIVINNYTEMESGILWSIIVAIGKEVWDFFFDGNVELLDAIATIIGGTATYAVLSVL